MNWYCLADDDPDSKTYEETLLLNLFLGGTFLEVLEGLSLGREKGSQFMENLELILCEKLAQQIQLKAARLRVEEVSHK